MKTLLALALVATATVSHAQMDYAACGEYKLLSSCGPFASNAPVLITEQATYSLDMSCPAERLELCNLRYSLVSLMVSGKKYCVWGKLDRKFESPCSDDSIQINRAEKIDSASF